MKKKFDKGRVQVPQSPLATRLPIKHDILIKELFGSYGDTGGKVVTQRKNRQIVIQINELF